MSMEFEKETLEILSKRVETGQLSRRRFTQIAAMLIAACAQGQGRLGRGK